MPIIFVEFDHGGLIRYPTLSEFRAITLGYRNVSIFTRECTNVFNARIQYEGDETFEQVLSEHGVETMIVGGYNLVKCVLELIQGAIKRGKTVITSPQLLFGRPSLDPNCKHVTDALTYYELNTFWINEVEEIKRMLV